MVVETLVQEVTNFLGLGALLEILEKGDYRALATPEGFKSLVYPLVPFLLVIELALSMIHRRPHWRVYRVNFLIYLFNRVFGIFVTIAMIAFIIALLSDYALFQTSLTWYWFLYAYVVWEFAHFLYHYSSHKVRLLWCLHSTHHAPEDMNLSVAHAHFFLEGPYADIVRTSTCILLGVQPEMIFLIMLIDGTYGSFIHAGENLMKDGRLGVINKVILSPSHHRVHHARNPLYIDRNFCNLLNIWDHAFGTYQEEREDEKPEYGVTRRINSGSFLDVYFGEIVLLAKDVWKAPTLKSKLLYIIMPPGWSHTGDHKTANAIRSAHLRRSERDNRIGA